MTVVAHTLIDQALIGQAERNATTPVNVSMRGLFTTLPIAVAAVMAVPATATVEVDTRKVSRIVITQDVAPKLQVTPTVAIRKTPNASMRTVLRCKDGVCVNVFYKTAVPAPVSTARD